MWKLLVSTRPRVSGLLVLLAAQAALAASGLTNANRADLEELVALLADTAPTERVGVVQSLTRFASCDGVAPEVEALLLEATADSDREVAAVATAILSWIEAIEAGAVLCESPGTPRERAWVELEEARALLADPRARERSDVGHRLSRLVHAFPETPAELRELLEQASLDHDSDVSAPAAAALAYLDGELARPARPKVLSAEAQVEFQEHLDLLSSDAPDERWFALTKLRDMPLPVTEEALYLAAVVRLTDDPDPQVRRYALLTLAGALN